VLMLRFAGASRAVIVETANALKMLRAENNSCDTPDDDEELWRRLSKVTAGGNNNLIWRANLRPSDQLTFIEDIGALDDESVSHVGAQWHASIGHGQVSMMARAPVYHRESVRTIETLRQRADSFGGSLVIERAPIDIKNEVDSWGSSGPVSELAKRVKQSLDPQNIWSPGRF